ncbi:MAG: UDP-N-acetylmuramoyl-L-alanyl-D-glutamate--2,6-diaminopimelate ligase [Bacteroidia bacterium]|nr:MAG: UDP-N-acetylmuramoyl-L-alanyl-D-glutamate--2,6-diaminopimelate ligase [Bacteroidia bacterium]PIE86415.1 MAG: UDP-N-acetylmuramoyl-L-alanyl-D-glutamate--2,6-diaminopimelate ligase [Bacteroidia bacterium]
MAVLNEILKNCKPKTVIGNAECEISELAFDSRKVKKGAVFFAIRGTNLDGHDYVQAAVAQGAVALVLEEIPTKQYPSVTYVQVDDSAQALAFAASAFYGNPSSRLKLVGITGTNGKTTTATLLYRLFKNLGYKVGLISTVENRIDEQRISTRHTTPDVVRTNSLLKKMIDAGCSHCFMEVSSHAIVQQRISGLEFAGAIFTNITHEHLDYHHSFDKYIKAKKAFFDILPKEAFALVNNDDKNGQIMLQNCKARKYTFGLKGFMDFKCKIIESHFNGMQLDIDKHEVWSLLIGRFNAYNLLAVYACALLLSEDKFEVLQKLTLEKPVRGRFEPLYSEEGITAIIDYAHTPDALENVLQTINNIRSGAENLISLVGAGGDRDKSKRPLMAKIAAQYADKVILTSDNPRSEKPEAIIDDMKTGIDKAAQRKTLSIVDRREAIKTAIMLAKHGDIILIPGKGHEEYQEINGVRYDFNDKKIVSELLTIQNL